MPSVFLISDTHFGHAGVCQFTHPDDNTVKLRPWTDPDEMDEEMIRRWNERVKQGIENPGTVKRRQGVDPWQSRRL